MTKPKGLRTFLKNDDEMLWLGLMSRDAGTSGSRILGIRDGVIAWDFDRAVTLRLMRHDNEVQKTFAKRIATAVAMAFDGKLNELDDQANW